MTLDETFVSETPFLPGVSREYVKPMETHPVGGSRRALILDDDPMVGVLLDNLVGSFGFTTGRARTVSEARKMLKSLDPDVVLVDIDLGHGPSGLDFARILGRSHPHGGIPGANRANTAQQGEWEAKSAAKCLGLCTFTPRG